MLTRHSRSGHKITFHPSPGSSQASQILVRGRAACPGSHTLQPPAQRAETAGPRQPDLDERRARGPRRGAGGSAGQRWPPGPRRSGAERSGDTGGAAAAPDGTSALGPLVQAGASGEAFTGRFTPAFPSPPAQASLRCPPAHGPSPSAAPAPSHLIPLVLLFAALCPPSPFSGEVPPGLLFVYQPTPPLHPIPVSDPLFLLSFRFIRRIHLSLSPSQSQAPLVPASSCHPTLSPPPSLP